MDSVNVLAELEVILEESSKDSGKPEKYKIKNFITHTEPLILHGNGPSKVTLNYLSNYVPNTWNSMDGCTKCKLGHINLEYRNEKDWPIVFMSLFIELNTPFLEEQLNKLYNLAYPKNKIHLFIHNSVIILFNLFYTKSIIWISFLK